MSRRPSRSLRRSLLFPLALAVPISRPVAVWAATDPDRCAVDAKSVIDFGPGDTAGPSWNDPGAQGTLRRLSDAFAAKPRGEESKCVLVSVEQTAVRAVAAHPRDVEDRYALAVVLGLLADHEGGASKVRAASRMYDQLRQILTLAPDHVGAHHLLGRLQAGVMRMDRVTRWIATNLLGGAALRGASWDEAERNLTFAVQRAPHIPDYHFELAHLYADTGRVDLALREAQLVLAMDPSTAIEASVPEKAAALVARLTRVDAGS
jgi:tetratricopeptide (TPR) repeat protein